LRPVIAVSTSRTCNRRRKSPEILGNFPDGLANKAKGQLVRLLAASRPYYAVTKPRFRRGVDALSAVDEEVSGTCQDGARTF